SPTAQAGLQPIIVPEIRNVISTVEPGPLFGNRGEITGTDFRVSLADSGRDTAVGRGLGVDTGSPCTLGGQVATATGGVVQSAPRVTEWTGNRGAGYPTQQDAEAAIPRRQSQDPDYDWQVQPNDAAQFKLVGTLRGDTNELPTAGMPDTAAQADRARVRSEIQARLDASAAREQQLAQAEGRAPRFTSLQLNAPNPELEIAFNSVIGTLESAIPSAGRMVAFDNPQGPDGLAFGGTALVNLNAPQASVLESAPHELKHVIER